MATAGCGAPQQTTSQPPPSNRPAPTAANQPAPTATPQPATNQTSSAQSASALPSVDVSKIQATLTPDESLEVLNLEGGSKIVKGTVVGYKAAVWAIPVASGQTLVVEFKPSNSNLYMNVHDASDTSGTAVHMGELAGPKATIKATKDSVYLIKPFQPRAMARRNEKGDYELTVTRS
jgi:hypothetical protein